MPSPPRPSRIRNPAARATPFRLARFWLICIFFLGWAVVICCRLFLVQVVHHKEYVERADRQQERTYEVAPRRGILYDRNMREMAMTIKVDSIFAVPTEIDDKQAEARTLAAVVHVDPDDERTTAAEIARRLEEGRSFAWVARRVTPQVADRVRELVKTGAVKGIYFQKEFKRFYPDNELAAQVLGYVGLDDKGLGGIEQKFDSLLHGVPGRMFIAMDARRHPLSSTESDPQPGRNLQLTIDENIEFIAEQALDRAMQRTHADHGTIVIQDVHTGQILALAVRPTFNPNDFRYTTPDLLRDRAVSDVYEPGSVFKLVTYSAALEQNVTTPNSMINCQGGRIMLAGRVIHDDQSDHYFVIPVHKALEVSSDVAAVKLALAVGPQRFYQYIRAFGFGQRTGIGLPGETRGLLRPVSQWSGSSIGSLAIGQEVGVTPLQLVSMVSTIANGGVYLPPRVLLPGQTSRNQPPPALKPDPFKPNENLPDPLPPGAHRVISTYTAAEMRQMMEDVVLYGTGRPAQLDGYSSGGKTGTAQKIDPRTHRYSKTMHIASFAGIAPVNNPVIAVAVVIDNPKGAYYGTEVAAPVFAEVAQQVLEYLDVPHDIPLRKPKAAEKNTLSLAEDDGNQDQSDVNALYAAANELPSDDPLHGSAMEDLQDGGSGSVPETGKPQNATPPEPAASQPAAQLARAKPSQPTGAQVVVQEGRQVRVPSLIGLRLRDVIVRAEAAGLVVEITGSGTARAQAPAAGTMVPPGTKIVVHCAR